MVLNTTGEVGQAREHRVGLSFQHLEVVHRNHRQDRVIKYQGQIQVPAAILAIVQALVVALVVRAKILAHGEQLPQSMEDMFLELSTGILIQLRLCKSSRMINHSTNSKN